MKVRCVRKGPEDGRQEVADEGGRRGSEEVVMTVEMRY